MFMSCRVVVINFVLALIADNKAKAGTTTAPPTATNSTNTTILTTTTHSTSVIPSTTNSTTTTILTTAHSTTVMPTTTSSTTVMPTTTSSTTVMPTTTSSTTVMPTTNSLTSSLPISTFTSPFTTTTEFDTSINETDHTNSSSAITSIPTLSTAEALKTTQPHSTTILETIFTESTVSSTIPSSMTSAESPRTSTPVVTMTQTTNSAIGNTRTDPRVTLKSDNSTESINSLSSTMSSSKQPTEKHSYLTFLPMNGSCTQYYGYKLTDQQDLCVSICEDKKCGNGGVCEVVQELPDDTTKLKPRCRCKESSDEIFEGENCEVSKLGRWKERAITLGVLIPLASIALLILICTCRKLTRHGKAERDFRNKYNVNTGNL